MSNHVERCDLLVAEHADLIPVHADLDRPAWLQARRAGIGGSDAGTILGVNPYQGPFELWLNKTGQIDDKDLTGSEPVYWGNVLEHIVCNEFARRADTEVWAPTGMFRSKTNQWQLGSPDRFCVDPENGEPAVFEAKTAGDHLADQWADGAVPDHYEAQVIHYAAVCGVRNAWIGALIGGQKFVWRRIDIDPDLVHDITEAERRFWETNVVAGHAPTPDASASCTDTLRDMWDAMESTALLDSQALDVALGYLEAHDEMKAAEERKTELGNWLRNQLGANSYGAVDGHQVVTHKEAPNNRFDIDAFSKAHPDLYLEFMSNKTTRRLHVPKAIRKLAPQ